MCLCHYDKLKKYFIYKAALGEGCVLFSAVALVPRHLNVFSLKDD